MPPSPHGPHTPAPLFFTYDFIHRTRAMLAQIPARALEAEAEAEAEHEEREAALERYTDCVGRAVLAEIIVVGGIRWVRW